ncbi:MAG: insulinase family protein [Candidatus Eisenbacteria bacterium]|nr:insulinase family protein [Candidatus Eisenbacteria bacterium]
MKLAPAAERSRWSSRRETMPPKRSRRRPPSARRGLRPAASPPPREERLHRRVLPGGLTVAAEEIPGSRSVALGIWIRCGSRHEPRSRAGLTHFLEHMLFRGSRRRGALALAKAIERIGGQVDASTGKESTGLFARLQPENVAPALALAAEIIAQPRLRPDLVEREKRVVIEEIRSYEDEPEESVYERMAGLLWPDHPMGRPILGYQETVRTLTPETIRRYHERRYRGSNVVVTAAGALDSARFVDAAARIVDLPPGGGRGVRIPLPRPGRRGLSVRQPLTQTHLCLATRGPSYGERERYPVYVLNMILGAGPTSRLFRKIRESEGLAYSIHSYVDSFEDTGAFGIYLSVDPRNLGRSFRLLKKELSRMRREGVKSWELENAKEQMILMHLLSEESVSERMGRLALKEFLYRDQPTDRHIIERIRGVTAADVERTVARVLDPRRFCLVALGPHAGNGIGIDDVDF